MGNSAPSNPNNSPPSKESEDSSHKNFKPAALKLK